MTYIIITIILLLLLMVIMIAPLIIAQTIACHNCKHKAECEKKLKSGQNPPCANEHHQFEHHSFSL